MRREYLCASNGTDKSIRRVGVFPEPHGKDRPARFASRDRKGRRSWALPEMGSAIAPKDAPSVLLTGRKPDWDAMGREQQEATARIQRIERVFGRPAAIYHAAGWIVVSYRENLLERVVIRPPDTKGRPAIG